MLYQLSYLGIRQAGERHWQEAGYSEWAQACLASSRGPVSYRSDPFSRSLPPCGASASSSSAGMT